MIQCRQFRTTHYGFSILNALLQLSSYHKPSFCPTTKWKNPYENSNHNPIHCYGNNLDGVKSSNRMITEYIRQGDLNSAYNVFKNMSIRTTITYNSLLTGYTKAAGRVQDARQLFDKIPEPDIVSYNTMLNCYMRNCGIKAAQAFFDQMLVRDTASWNTMLSGLCQNGMMDDARQLFDEMPERNNVSWNVMISGYAATGDLVVAEKLFRNAPVKCVVAWTAMVTGYMKSRKVDLAEKMFDEMPERNLVTWNTMVSGYVENGRADDGLKLFRTMVETGLSPIHRP
ncbi:putative tetratricopeptide-like helical domain superfamily [Helianthus annuus]|nr:putative tetratricopeptide-like helical domain superfamily [Helianthus annuus]